MRRSRAERWMKKAAHLLSEASILEVPVAQELKDKFREDLNDVRVRLALLLEFTENQRLMTEGYEKPSLGYFDGPGAKAERM
jgi:hypothetical protein